MEGVTLAQLFSSLIAVGVGLVIGLEREHSEVTAEVAEKPRSGGTLLGVRTFAILGLLGWIAGFLAPGWPWVPPVVLLATALLAAAQYLRTAEDKPGLTTEFAALVTVALGMVVHKQRLLAVALGLGTTLLLISKPWFRSVVPRLRRIELTATLQLLIAMAIVLPLLPTEASDPWGVLSPRRIGLFVVLIAGISYVGYVLCRVLGEERGAGLTGAIGGLASSTAVTAAMAQRARRSDAMVVPGQLATFLANAVMCARVLVVTAVISPRVAMTLAAPLTAIGLCMLAGALWKWRHLRTAATRASAPLPLRNPFALLPALKWGIILCVVLVVSALAQQFLGDNGLLATAAASGLADVDAVTLAAGRQVAGGGLSPRVAAVAITIAVVSNTVVKATIAWVGAGRAYGSHVAGVFAMATAAGIMIAAVQ